MLARGRDPGHGSGLRASWLQEIVPLDPSGLEREPHLSTLAGHLAESAVGSALSTIASLELAHLPARTDQPEVDFVVTIGTKRIPIEVKYHRRIDRSGTRKAFERSSRRPRTTRRSPSWSRNATRRGSPTRVSSRCRSRA